MIYVWFDALTNYISALGFGDPRSNEYRRWWLESDRRVHVIGKGILRFHALYWPAFLASAGQPPPSRIQVHPYLTVGGEKFSKSGRTSVRPARIADDLGTDALRWWFARDVGRALDEPTLPKRRAGAHQVDADPPMLDGGSLTGSPGLWGSGSRCPIRSGLGPPRLSRRRRSKTRPACCGHDCGSSRIRCLDLGVDRQVVVSAVELSGEGFNGGARVCRSPELFPPYQNGKRADKAHNHDGCGALGILNR